jgi:uroporphyrinogen-III synthase
VLALESRRGPEIATLIGKLGGECLLAPALREVPLESNAEAVRFAGALADHAFDVVVFLTGVGARALLAAVEHEHPREKFLAALSRVRVAVRGPKPLAVMREWQVPVWLVAPEPNTWRELMAELDARGGPLTGVRVAVQEYGVSNPELLNALSDRGAVVARVPVYQWTLPDDVTPLRNAASALARGDVDVVVLTSGVQMAHLWQIVEELGLADDVRRSLGRTVIASIGPTTTEEIHRRGLAPDLQASHPKMGILVTEAASMAGEILRAKRG